MKLFDIVVFTDHRWINPSKIDAYTRNVLHEDELVVNALKNAGLSVIRKSWDDPVFNWKSARSLLFRTTWDYFDRFTEFSKWLNYVSKHTILFNSEKVIRWNLDKHYLTYLQDKGIHIASTYFIEQGETKKLLDVINYTKWYESVLKPCISGAARHTYRINLENYSNYENIFASLLKNESLMLQPFQNAIMNEGEMSLMVINGTYTHAILKKAKPGDFRVQDDFGGTVHEYEPSLEMIKIAENAVANCIEKPIYARVDIFRDNEDKWAVSELELIEPELWFRYNPEAAVQLANALAKQF